ncbi:MAG: FAD-dependent monooxygenase [Burkholderiales bacterium]|nr:FAD-dependent monooxygenase [Burkholderiales bacterium]
MNILIAGGGIGGLAAALSLNAAGLHEVQVLEAAAEIRQVGVGVNLPPHAVRELTELGLGEALAQHGIPTSELSYYDRRGKLIWAEPRGLGAGYRWPQYSIHRGRLQQILFDAVVARMGEAVVRTGQRVSGFVPMAAGVRVQVADRSGASSATDRTIEADLLIGADGIRSAVRQSADPALGALATNGWMMYRGTTRSGRFLSGSSMVIIGDEHLRVVVYPIEPGVNNWLLVRPAECGTDQGGTDGVATGQGATAELGNWNRSVEPRAIAQCVQDWTFDWLDVPAMVAGSDIAWEYPMADFDPLSQWVFGRAALLGDAAHAMYPFGSNGASQAILDARVLAWQLAVQPDIDAALVAYQAERLPVASAVQLANRRQANDVMVKVSAMVRQDEHAGAQAELKEVEARYKRLAGFDAETLNARASWSVGGR